MHAHRKDTVEKIRVAIGNGIERRPKRAASSTMIDGVLGMLDEAITAKDAKLLGERFAGLTATCNAWHQAEKMPFVVVQPPQVRISPTGPRRNGIRPRRNEDVRKPIAHPRMAPAESP